MAWGLYLKYLGTWTLRAKDLNPRLAQAPTLPGPSGTEAFGRVRAALESVCARFFTFVQAQVRSFTYVVCTHMHIYTEVCMCMYNIKCTYTRTHLCAINHLSVYLSACLSTCLSICLPTYPSIHSSIHLCIRPSIHPSTHPSISLHTYTTIYVIAGFCIYAHVPLSLSLSLPLSLCACIYIYVYVCIYRYIQICIRFSCM